MCKYPVLYLLCDMLQKVNKDLNYSKQKRKKRGYCLRLFEVNVSETQDRASLMILSKQIHPAAPT